MIGVRTCLIRCRTPIRQPLHHCNSSLQSSPVSLSCRIHQRHICREVWLPQPNKWPGHDSKQSDGYTPEILDLWGMRYLFFAIAQSQLWSYLWIKYVLNWIVWNRNFNNKTNCRDLVQYERSKTNELTRIVVSSKKL